LEVPPKKKKTYLITYEKIEMVVISLNKFLKWGFYFSARSVQTRWTAFSKEL
jgi:hypothetical protein